MQFFETKGGHEFYYGTMPRIARSLEKIGDQLELLVNVLSQQSGETIQTEGALSATKEEIKPFYFTFGSDKQFPYQNTYVIVLESSIANAICKFRGKYPDKHKNTVNCSFIYNEEEWWGIKDGNKVYDEPAEILGTGINYNLTWDDIYTLADGCACGSWQLNAKDNAREETRQWALDHGFGDIEDTESAEEAIDRLDATHNFEFTAEGKLVSADK